jgi:FAD dependent monooxygenase
MTPNMGQGANMAIEDAARLASLLDKRLNSGDLFATEIYAMLEEFSTSQKPRAKSICAQSEFLVRMHANEGIWRRVLGRYLVPFLHDAPAGLSGLSISGATKLEFIDSPGRSLGGAWEASWESILRSLACLRPKLGFHRGVYLIVVLCVIFLVCRE